MIFVWWSFTPKSHPEWYLDSNNLNTYYRLLLIHNSTRRPSYICTYKYHDNFTKIKFAWQETLYFYRAYSSPVVELHILLQLLVYRLYDLHDRLLKGWHYFVMFMQDFALLYTKRSSLGQLICLECVFFPWWRTSICGGYLLM